MGRVFVTGGSGFVGSAIIDELLARGHGINALVNRQALVRGGDVRIIPGDLFNPAALDLGLAGCQAVIHLVGIIREQPKVGITFQRIHFQGTCAVVDAALRNGVKRYVQMSALGVRADAVSEYHKSKWQAEEYVRGSALDWTILRPSMIHGPGGEFIKMQVRWARWQSPPYFFMPYFGRGLLGYGGAGMVQPVYVRDVARAFAEALENGKTIGQTYGLGGEERLTWPQFHQAVARAAIGRKRLALPIPAWYAKLLAGVLPASWLAFNRDQVIMSLEGNTCDLADFRRDFGWTPRGFTVALHEYGKENATAETQRRRDKRRENKIN